MCKEIMQEDSGRSGLPAATMRTGREAVTALLKLVIIHWGDRCWRGDILVQVSQGNAVCLCNMKVWVRVSTSPWNKKTPGSHTMSINKLYSPRSQNSKTNNHLKLLHFYSGSDPCCEPVEGSNCRHLVRYKFEVLALFLCLFLLLLHYNSKGNFVLFFFTIFMWQLQSLVALQIRIHMTWQVGAAETISGLTD